MTRILHRSIGPELPRAVAAEGIWITDAEGRRYIDGSGGAAVTSLGHGNPEVLDAMRAQMDAVAYAHTSFFTSDVAESLADRLIGLAPDGLDYVYLGYWIEGSARMAYKARFRPLERLGPDGWSRFEPTASDGIAAAFELAIQGRLHPHH